MFTHPDKYSWGISCEYLPGWPEPTEEEIIRLCLCHTSYLHKCLKLYISQTKKSLNSRSKHQRCLIEKAVPKKFLNIHRKTTVLESLFNRVAGLKACNFIKRDSNTATQVFSWEYCKIFKNTYSEENLRTTASGIPASYC